MFYKPSKGKMKDDCMIYHKGKYYMYSMYAKQADYNAGPAKYNNIWLAISNDGIHFEDYGCVVEDSPFLIWAMKVYKVDDGFFMNSGSFGGEGAQNVLKFWYSKDLINWTYHPELDITAPKVNGQNVRLDCMNVIRADDGTYYGYATGYFNFLKSVDGAHWEICEGEIDTYPFPKFKEADGGFEIADCIYFGDKYYLLCGAFGYMGTYGYSVFVFESEKPFGPFKPSLPNFRINGTSKRWVNMWERAFACNDEMLAHNYMYDGYSYENGNSYLPPIKKLVIEDNTLCLKWWDNNNQAYGKLLKEVKSLKACNVCCDIRGEDAVPVIDLYDYILSQAVIIEGTVTLKSGGWVDASKGGIYLEDEQGIGTAIVFSSVGKTEIYSISGENITLQDEIGYGSAVPYWISEDKPYNFRLLCKNGLFELYINDSYIQTFNTAHRKNIYAPNICRFGAVSFRGEGALNDIKIFEMK